MIAELIVFILGMAVAVAGANMILEILLVIAIMLWVKEGKEE